MNREGRVGPGVILKVMAGDKINARTFAWYQPTGMDNTTNSELTGIITNLLGQLVPGITGAAHGTIASQATNGVVQPGMESFLGTQNAPPTGAPKAYLNWVLLDEEQFKLVEGNYGAVPIQPITGTQQKQLLQANNGNPIEMTKNGYLYVYVSNESKGNIYFDDIRIDHIHGPLTEETHYYPFGLTMVGISSKALKPNYAENKFRFNGIEQTTDLDMNQYDAFHRTLDPQIGRFWQIDPEVENFESFSPYESMGNNPVNNVDPLGDFANRFSAWWYKIWHGGTVSKNQYGEWYVYGTRTETDANGNPTVVATRHYGKGRNQYTAAGENIRDEQETKEFEDRLVKKGVLERTSSLDEAKRKNLQAFVGVLMPNAVKIISIKTSFKTLGQLREIVAPNAKLFRELFGVNEKGAQLVLDNIKNVKIPEGLTKEAIEAYRDLINRVPDPRGTQAIRAKILDAILETMK